MSDQGFIRTPEDPEERANTLTAPPLRHVIMIGLIWRLGQDVGRRPLTVIEVGSWAGISALTWAYALDKFAGGGRLICIDPWVPYTDLEVNDDVQNAYMDASLRSGSIFDTFQENIAKAPDSVEVVIHRATSASILPTLPPSSVDLVFLDGDHTLPRVRQDIELARQLVGEHGILAGDDLDAQLHDYPEVARYDGDDIDVVTDKEGLEVFHPGVTIAVAEAFGPVSCWYGVWAVQSNGETWTGPNLEEMPFHIPPNLPRHSQTALKLWMTSNGNI